MTLPAKKLARKLGPKGVAATIGDDAARMLRIRRLLAAHLNDQARREARAAQASMKANRCELLYIEGKANRKMRRYKGAVKAFSAAREACRDGDEKQPWWFKASLLETQVRSIRGDLGGARKVAMALAEHTEHSYADDALFRLADLNGRRSRPKQARRLYTQIVEDHPRGDQVPIAAWRLALAELRRGRHDAARPWLERLANSLAPTSRDGARARYWLARGLEASDRPRALKLYRAAVKTPPLTFYAWLALARLRRVAPPVAKELQLELQALRDRVASSTAASSAPTSVDASPERRRARALQAIGWSAEAARELKLLEHDAMTEPEVVALALAYDELQEHQWAQWLLRSRAKGALSRFPTGPTLEVWKAAYSRPYLDEVSRASKATGVPALLLFGLSREESTFDPRVISWAGAVGLMQLMPATAVGAYADVYRKRLTDMSRLTDPALNARLGAHVLKTGLDDFGQSVPLALAAYNGGHGLARKTLPRGRKQAFDLWVESITVRQTRRYVKKVVGTWGKYRFLYDAKAPFIELPAHVPARPAPPKEPPKDPPKANK